MALPNFTAQDVIAAMKVFDDRDRGVGDWADWENNKNHIYAIYHASKRYPVKQIVSEATGVPRSQFTGGIASWDANPRLERLGFHVRPLPNRNINDAANLRTKWLEAFSHLGDLAYNLATALKSPQVSYKGWRFGAEHQRKFRAMVIRKPPGAILTECPSGWMECPPSDKNKDWDYRVEMLPDDFGAFVREVDRIGRLVARSDRSIEADFTAQVKAALKDQREARLKRLAAAPRVPERVEASTSLYIRNADVIAEVLFLANGICGQCKQPAPFVRKSDGTPYLEVHHRKQLAHGGEDTVENGVALCPNCHKQFHFG